MLNELALSHTLAAPPLVRLGEWFRQLDVRTRRVTLLLIGVLLLNALDLLCTLSASRIDIFAEANPVAEGLFEPGLRSSLIAFKLIMVGGGCALLWVLRRSRWAVAGCWLLLLVYTGLGVVWCLWVKDITYTYEVDLFIMTPVRQLVQR